MPSQIKETFVAELADELKKTPHVVVTEYQGMKAEEFNELRAVLRPIGATYKVVKNRLAKIAFKKIGWESLTDKMKGPSAIAYQKGDAVAMVRVLSEFCSKHQNLKLKAGYVLGMTASADDLRTISKLPSREVLLATLLARLNSPLTTFLRTLQEPVRSLHAALTAVAKKKETAPTA